jgi:2-amino-4-hydroxy-6-hydroxymethyldihydropteridine diphosphokinase
MTRLAYIALGSNLPSPHGNPAETLCAAVAQLPALGRLVALSSLYETDPAGYHDQPVFLNAVAAVATQLAPETLLQRLLALERQFGRRRKGDVPKGPRTLDLDLLLMDDLVVHAEKIVLPHPALASRRFVLAPLAEIAPQLRHPVLQRSAAELLAALPEEGENRVDAVRRLDSAAWKALGGA